MSAKLFKDAKEYGYRLRSTLTGVIIRYRKDKRYFINAKSHRKVAHPPAEEIKYWEKYVTPSDKIKMVAKELKAKNIKCQTDINYVILFPSQTIMKLKTGAEIIINYSYEYVRKALL